MKRTKLILCTILLLAGPALYATGFADDREQTLQNFLAEAGSARAKGDLAAAAESYRKAVEVDSSIPELWTNLGLMDHETGKHAEAIQSFKKAIEINPALFVPQLFLGIEYLAARDPNTALPFLKTAVKLNPKDPQAALSLGRAYSMLEQGSEAAEAYWRATQLAPNDGNAWLELGMAYLQQVDSDARVMTSTYKNSSYTKLRAGELFAEQGKLIQAADAYKADLSAASPPPCSHAGYGIVLLRQKEIGAAKAELDRESSSPAGCPLKKLGYVAMHVVQGETENALKELVSIWNADEGFLQEALPLLRGGITDEQTQQLIALANATQASNRIPAGIVDAIHAGLASDTPPIASLSNFGDDVSALEKEAASQLPEDPEKLYISGRFHKCSESLQSRLGYLTERNLLTLAPCAFYAGDERTASMAARKLTKNSATRQIGLYWESKANQKLAIAALTRAGEIDANSPRMHVLLGDVYRQTRRWDDAEAEYRKALALEPESRAGRLGLAIALFEGGNSEDAFAADKKILQRDPDDPEANMLAGEILVQQHQFSDAEANLNKCRDIGPEFISRVHALLGEIYAKTNRDREALAEFKLVTTGDNNGSIHYQLARLYQKIGDKKSAAEAFQASKRLREQWDASAVVAVEQSGTDISRH